MAQSSSNSAGVVQVWQRLTSTVVHSSTWFDLCLDEVVQPGGKRGNYHHVVALPSATVLALHDDDRVVLTRQWVYTHGGTEWRLPGGVVDRTNADPLAAARRELAQQTGLCARRWEQIGQIHGADSLSNHVDHIFLASDLSQGDPARVPGEADLHVRAVPFGHAIQLVADGMIPHAGSAHALITMALRRTECEPDEPMILASGSQVPQRRSDSAAPRGLEGRLCTPSQPNPTPADSHSSVQW